MADKIEKRIEDVCIRMLSAARSELYVHMRFLDVALSTFTFVLSAETETVATDGIGFYYNPSYIGGIYRKGRACLNRVYLHLIFHCIFAHPWKDNRIRKKAGEKILGIQKEEKEEAAPSLVNLLWEIACDIAVEHMTDKIMLSCVRMPSSAFRQAVYRRLEQKRKVLNAESIFAVLVSEKTSEEQAQRLRQEFHVDDHSIWNRKNRQNPNRKPEEEWEEIRDKMQTELESFGSEEAQGASQGVLEQIRTENRDTCDYRQFLQKFAVMKEEQKMDPDAFDYGFYTYGLSFYGNMPLIEPLETKEVKKIEEFVIAIDTSMSCSGELVKEFLAETWSILRETESFFRKVNIHIIQCDERVRRDDKITSQEELKNYMEHLELEGRGGTDFRPVFAYVQEMMRKKEVTSLKGLLYFTDGKGRFPVKMPPYETAFILMQKEYEQIQVPPWAIAIYFDEDNDLGKI